MFLKLHVLTKAASLRRGAHHSKTCQLVFHRRDITDREYTKRILAFFLTREAEVLHLRNDRDDEVTGEKKRLRDER